MLEENKSGQGTMIGVLLVILSIAGYVFYTAGVAGENAKIKTEIEAKSAEISLFEAENVKVDSAKEALNLTGVVDQITSIAAVPADLKQDDVIKTVIDVADAFDIVLNSISFSRSSSELDGVSVLRINASFEGNYADLIDFLEGLEEDDRLFLVDSINVQIAKVGISDLERANFSLSIDTFYQQ